MTTKLETHFWQIEDDGSELIIRHKFSNCEISIREVEDKGDEFDHLQVSFENSCIDMNKPAEFVNLRERK